MGVLNFDGCPNWENEMTILELGAIGEFVGSLAVLATLAYLALQIRHNTASNRLAAKLEITRQYADYVDFLLLNPGLRELNNKGMNDQELDPDETQRFIMMLSKAFWYFSSMHYQYRMGVMSAGEWIQSDSLISGYCSSPRVRRWWDVNRTRYGEEFRAFIDGLAKDAATSGGTPFPSRFPEGESVSGSDRSTD
jgi:hypothetical protein